MKAMWVLGFGCFMTLSGALIPIIGRIVISEPPNDGVIIGFTAISMSGLAVVMIGSCLQALEKRLDKIEGSK